MRVLTVCGTRPEIIRLSRIIPALDALCEHRLVHTGQNSDPGLSELFFRELGVRAPDDRLEIASASFAEQLSRVVRGVDAILEDFRPDRVVILGDTNSGLAAIAAARRRIPVLHLEAGNRCYDDRVPEELNRRLIDHASTLLLPYTQRSMENLVREGIERERIFVIGNPIFEVLTHYAPRIDGSDVLSRLSLAPGEFLLATLHRAENVDDAGRLASLLQALAASAESLGIPVVLTVHPRTRDRLAAHGLIADSAALRLVDPLGFFDFVRLEQTARAVLSDSGTVQEECAILGRPAVTLRDVTERPETLECGSNVLAGTSVEDVGRVLRAALLSSRRWAPPSEYLVPAVSDTVAKLVVGRLSVRSHR
ncbi:MAG: UDP-N-acetylglucosamine 2-epimerase (non-hydrolyzing) [Thermoanaerobaculia bacterium]